LLPEPLVLGFDTSAAHCAAALLAGEELLAERYEAMARGQAERLFGLLEDLLAEVGMDWRDLAALGVGVGPGNFTGIRISVAAARGLALSLGIPAVGVSTFAAAGFGASRPVVVALDGHRGSVYAQRLTAATDGAPQIVPIAGLAAFAGRARIITVEPGLLAPELGALAPKYPLARAIALIASRSRSASRARPAPLYIRPADAAPAHEPPPVLLP